MNKKVTKSPERRIQIRTHSITSNENSLAVKTMSEAKKLAQIPLKRAKKKSKKKRVMRPSVYRSSPRKSSNDSFLCLTKKFFMKNFSSKLLLLIVLITSISVVSAIVKSYSHDKSADMVPEYFNWKENYEKTINYIKKHEGFNDGKPYQDVGGTLTIGYGHVVLGTDSFPEQMSQSQAEKLLRSDFNKALKFVEDNTDLKDNKRLAIAHFIFAVGVGNYLKSKLPQLIKERKPIDGEILKWGSFSTPSGKKIKSKYALDIRKWELKLYKSDGSDQY